MWLRLLAIGLAVGVSLAGQPVETDAHKEKIEHIRKLMALTGGEDAMDRLFKQLSGVGGSGEMLEKFRKEFDWKRLTEVFVAAYDRNFSDAEVRELIRFYESPVGRKMVQITPRVMGEVMKATSDMVQGMVERLQKQGSPGVK